MTILYSSVWKESQAFPYLRPPYVSFWGLLTVPVTVRVRATGNVSRSSVHCINWVGPAVKVTIVSTTLLMGGLFIRHPLSFIPQVTLRTNRVAMQLLEFRFCNLGAEGLIHNSGTDLSEALPSPFWHMLSHILMFCLTCIIAYQYNEIKVIHFSFSLLRIKGIYMFPALLAHPQEVLYKRYLVYCVRIMSVDCGMIAVKLQSWHSQLHYTHAVYQVPFV
jgi:hypothetical protein